MNLMLKLDLDMFKMYHHTKHEISMSTYSKVTAQTDTHRDRHTHIDRQTHRHDKNITSTTHAGGKTCIRKEQQKSCRVIKKNTYLCRNGYQSFTKLIHPRHAYETCTPCPWCKRLNYYLCNGMANVF